MGHMVYVVPVHRFQLPLDGPVIGPLPMHVQHPANALGGLPPHYRPFP